MKRSTINSKQKLLKDSAAPWTFFTNHTHVLVYLSLHGSAPLKDVANAIGITERAVQRIVRDLELGGTLSHKRVGRNNHYHIHSSASLRHALENHCTIGQILDVVLKGSKKK